MRRPKAYPSIDAFRLVAALLVVAIHTAPLSDLSPTADFILTRVVARVAVPFFFMTSGFFLFGRCTDRRTALAAFLKKTALIYLIAIVLYLPINLYNGYFSGPNLLPRIIRDVLLDGTLYHLWYLPASMVGALIAYGFIRQFGYGRALALTALLYAAGLLGDSYYGLAAQTPGLREAYSAWFEVSDYTRNGLFFAPIFFVMGGLLASLGSIRLPKPLYAWAGFVLSLAAMIAEGLLLSNHGLQKHDSMYLALIPCMFCLFCALLSIRGSRLPLARGASLALYIIHPMVIVLLRFVARPLGLTGLMVDNNLVHFFAVALLSLIAAGGWAWLERRWHKAHPRAVVGQERAWIEIDHEALRRNVQAISSALPHGCRIMAVVKAEAYGHGAPTIALTLEQLGVEAFAVATLEEGIRLRQSGLRGSILVLGYTHPSLTKAAHRYRLTLTVADAAHGAALDAAGYPVQAHIKVDTGMHRLGVDARDADAVTGLFALKHLRITGMYTHLCASDSLAPSDTDFTLEQIRRFDRLVKVLEKKGVRPPALHVQSSYGLLNYPQLQYDYVRVGIALYGCLSAPGDRTRLKLPLRPALSLKARVALIRMVPAGESVGYGRAFTALRDTRIALLPIGYADGYPRALSEGGGYVLLHGHAAPVIGRICMDQLMVDVTDIPEAAAGDIAVLIGQDAMARIGAADLAGNAGSIANELLSRMGRRLTWIHA